MSNGGDIAATLPELERQVFDAVTTLGVATVHQVTQSLLEQGRPLAYTTVMTVLARLWGKGYLLRSRAGKAYRYQARNRAAIASDMGERAAHEAIAKYGDLALTGFVRTLTPAQRGLLAQLLEQGGERQGETDGPR